MKFHHFAWIVLLHFFSCGQAGDQYSDGAANDGPAQEVPNQTKLHPEESESIEGFELPSGLLDRSIVADFDRDGSNDTLVLAVNAEVDGQGRIAWDDAHVWRVYVASTDGILGLYQQDIQSGVLEVYYDEASRLIYLSENAPYRKLKFRIEPADNFERTQIYDLPSVSDFKTMSFD